MAKARIVGKVVTTPVEGTNSQGTKFKKFGVSVTKGSAKTAKSSFFGVILYGKLSEVTINKGQVVCVDGRMSIEDFRLDESRPVVKTCIVTPNKVEILSGSHVQEAKAYNMLGNLARDAERLELHKSDGTKQIMFKNAMAVNRKVGNDKVADFYDLLWFGERGEKIAQYLTKGKKIMVDGSLQAEYYDKKDGSGKGLNVSIAVDDLEFACGPREESEATQANAKPQAQPQAAPEIPAIDIDDEEIPF